MISLCMIVRDEAESIHRCLDSVQPYVDEINIVDTGSEDATVEMCSTYDCNIVTTQWAYDFAQHRNESVDMATEPWILWMDADEELSPRDGELLREFVNKLPETVDACDVQIASVQNGGRTQTLSSNLRLFQNHKGIKFKGRIHEGLDLPEERTIVQAPFQIKHYGYNYTGEQKQKKLKRNEEMILALMADEPENYYVWFTLIKNLHAQRRYADVLTEAAQLYQQGQQWFQERPGFRASLYNIIAQAYMEHNEYQNALYYLKQSLLIMHHQIQANYLLYECHLQRKEYDEAYYRLMRTELDTNFVQIQGKQLATDYVIAPQELHARKKHLVDLIQPEEKAPERKMSRDGTIYEIDEKGTWKKRQQEVSP